MADRNTFRLVAGGIGLGFLGMGLADEFGAIFTALGLQSRQVYTPVDRAAAGVAYILAGVVLILAAKLFARFLCGKPEA